MSEETKCDVWVSTTVIMPGGGTQRTNHKVTVNNLEDDADPEFIRLQIILALKKALELMQNQTSGHPFHHDFHYRHMRVFEERGK